MESHEAHTDCTADSQYRTDIMETSPLDQVFAVVNTYSDLF
jgi:hypothetical protein